MTQRCSSVQPVIRLVHLSHISWSYVWHYYTYVCITNMTYLQTIYTSYRCVYAEFQPHNFAFKVQQPIALLSWTKQNSLCTQDVSMHLCTESSTWLFLHFDYFITSTWCRLFIHSRIVYAENCPTKVTATIESTFLMGNYFEDTVKWARWELTSKYRSLLLCLPCQLFNCPEKCLHNEKDIF